MNTPVIIMRARVLGLSFLAVGSIAYAASRVESPRGVTFVAAAQVEAAFAAGAPIVENERYKIHASRREAPGMAEVHARDTDIIYVLDGTATIVTGGSVVGEHTTARDEIRGASIRGGTEQRLGKGDIFIVPNGVPHWFTQVSNPFLYYVVKATDSAAGAR